MSRTFRRKTMNAHDVRALGYLYLERETYGWGHIGLHEKWTRYEFDEYDDYRREHLSKFYRDWGYDSFVNYKRSPAEYRKRRNKILRAKHRSELSKVRLDYDVDVALTPFVHNAGWDYW